MDRSGTVRRSDRSAWARVADTGDIIVPALTVADILAVFGDGPLDLAKVDIEGAEPLVVPQILDAAASMTDFALIYESNQAVTDIDVGALHRAVADAGTGCGISTRAHARRSIATRRRRSTR